MRSTCDLFRWPQCWRDASSNMCLSRYCNTRMVPLTLSSLGFCEGRLQSMLWVSSYIYGNSLWMLLEGWSEWSCSTWQSFRRGDHTIVLEKLTNLGLPNFLIRWLTRFLCQHEQRVKVGQHLSDWSQVNARVPLCIFRVVGSVSFLLHINDLQTIANHTKYVDDSSLWEVCRADGSDSGNKPSSCVVWQGPDVSQLWPN